jgi:hypothetical protein
LKAEPSLPALRVKVDNRERRFRVTAFTIFVDQKNRRIRPGIDSSLLREGVKLRITTGNKGDKDVAVRVQLLRF